MKVVTLSNEKGGVGKTTMALHIAAGLALRDMRVLLIDTDSQGHCGTLLGLEAYGGLYRLLAQEAQWREVLRVPATAAWAGTAASIGELVVLQSNIETRALPQVIDNPLLLAHRLDELRGRFDAVVIDTSPTPSLFQSVVYCATAGLIFPMRCEMLSLDGLAKTSTHVDQQNKARAAFGLGPMDLLGVLPTMYQDCNAHRFAIDLVERHYGPKLTWTPVAQRTIWRDREFACKTMYAFAPGHEATAEMNVVVDRVASYVA